MATHSGNSGKVQVGVNAVAEVTAFTVTENANTHDDSALGDVWDTHLGGSKSWSAEIECWWDEADTNGQLALAVGASVTVGLYPEGSASGATYLSGKASVTAVSKEVRRNQTISQRFSVQGNGELTTDTVSGGG